jgi:acetyl esterase/lipase
MRTLTGLTVLLSVAEIFAILATLPAQAVAAKTVDRVEDLREGPSTFSDSLQDQESPDGVEIVSDLAYATRGDQELRLDIYRPDFSNGPFPAVILIHGHFPISRDRQHYAPLAVQLARQGMVAVTIDYRQAVDAPYPAAVEDARAAIGWIRDNAEEHHVRSNEIAVLGESFGGYVSAMLGVVSDESDAPSARAAVLIQAPVDLLSYEPTATDPYDAFPYVYLAYLGAPQAQRPDLWKQASPLEYVDSRAAKFFFYPSSRPSRVPVAQSTAMVRALHEGGVEAEVISREGAGRDLLTVPHEVDDFARTVANLLKDALWTMPDGVEVRKDVVYASPGGRDLHLDLYLPDETTGPLPIVMFIHGGGWIFGDKEMSRDAASYLAGEGFAAATIEYRLSNERIYPAAVDDSKAAVRWLRANASTFGGDPDRLGVVGTSAGGQLAALLAVTPDISHFAEGDDSPGVSVEVQAVVPVAAPVDMVAQDQVDPWNLKVFMGSRPHEAPELWRQASPIHFAKQSTSAFLFMHFTEDDVRYVDVETMRERLLSAGLRAEIFTATGRGHGVLTDPRYRDASLVRLASFLREELGPGGR